MPSKRRQLEEARRWTSPYTKRYLNLQQHQEFLTCLLHAPLLDPSLWSTGWASSLLLSLMVGSGGDPFL